MVDRMVGPRILEREAVWQDAASFLRRFELGAVSLVLDQLKDRGWMPKLGRDGLSLSLEEPEEGELPPRTIYFEQQKLKNDHLPLNALASWPWAEDLDLHADRQVLDVSEILVDTGDRGCSAIKIIGERVKGENLTIVRTMVLDLDQDCAISMVEDHYPNPVKSAFAD